MYRESSLPFFVISLHLSYASGKATGFLRDTSSVWIFCAHYSDVVCEGSSSDLVKRWLFSQTSSASTLGYNFFLAAHMRQSHKIQTTGYACRLQFLINVKSSPCKVNVVRPKYVH